jgi:CheY-like chemotaxis protein
MNNVETARPFAGKAHKKSGVRILIIDDDVNVRNVLVACLIFSGYQVVEASDGRSGIEQLRQHRISLVLTDVMMPDQDGFETILAIQKEFAGIPIVAMSGDGHSRTYLKISAHLGPGRVLMKPFEVAELVRTIADTLAAMDKPAN